MSTKKKKKKRFCQNSKGAGESFHCRSLAGTFFAAEWMEERKGGEGEEAGSITLLGKASLL